MGQRLGETGPILPRKSATLVVPALAAGVEGDVAFDADSAFIGAQAGGVLATLGGAPLANLAVVGAWVSNDATGVVTVRFMGTDGGCAGGNQLMVAQAF